MPRAKVRFLGLPARSPRWIGIILLFCCAGCYSCGPIGSAWKPNVFILRGTAGYFPCLCQFENKLLDEGVCPTVVYPAAYQKVAERIIAGRNTGRLAGPLVIVGYSVGADTALLLSRRLAARGILVDKLVLLEASDATCVPGNVRECFNIYKAQPWSDVVPIFRGTALSAETSETVLVNYNLRDYNDGRYDWDNHLTLSANPFVQDLMIDEIMAGFEPMPESRETIVETSGSQSVSDQVPPPAEEPAGKRENSSAGP